MAVITEFYKTREDGVQLYRTYSDKGMTIHKVGTDEVYSEAIDVENSGFEYEEATEPADTPTDEFTDSEFRRMVEEAL